MEFLFWTLIITILVDGIKLIVESFAHGKATRFGGEPDLVTVIIAAHNEEDTIAHTLASVARCVPMKNIIVVDDESSDRTGAMVRLYAPEARLITINHRGKVGAIHSALSHVSTPYVMLLDADVELADRFVIPTDALRDGHATAVSFNIVPMVRNNTPGGRLLLNLQQHEYAKSMQIGRKFNNVTKSVHCISGAAGLFKTGRLIQLSKDHTTIFPGEDLERTLLELNARGEVIFVDDEVLTDVPRTFASLSRQRIFGWWPGLWRNIWLFLKIVIRRKEPFRLRYEIVYELFSLFTDPMKILSLIGLLLGGAWRPIVSIYVLYLCLEILVMWRLQRLAGKYLNLPFLVALLFPFYSAMQMFYRAFAFGIFFWKRVLTGDWRKVRTGTVPVARPAKVRLAGKAAAALLLLAALSPCDAQERRDWSFGYQSARVHDQPMNRNVTYHQFHIGWKGLYAELGTAPYDRANVGLYYGSWWGDVQYRWESQDILTKLQYEKWLGAFVPRVQGGLFYQPGLGDAFPVAGAGLSWYFQDYSSLNLDVIKEWGRLFGSTLVGAIRMKDPEGGLWGTLGGSVTNFGHSGVFLQLGYGPFYVHGDFYEHYDFTSFDRMSYGLGYMMRF